MEEILAVAPESAESWVFRGDLLRSEGKSEEALAAYRKAAILQPANVSARKMLAATLLRKEQPQSATYVLEPLLAQPTDDAELLSLAGQAYLQIGQVRKALQFLERAVALDPANARIRTGLGLTRLAGGERRLAVDDLEAAVALKATDTRAENYLIMALVARGETSKALQAAQALEQKQPNKSVTHLLKGAVFLAQQDFVRARASFERSLALQPAYFPAAAALAQIDLREKNAEAARGRMEGVLKHDKKNLDAMLALAKFEFDAGRRSEAVARLRQAQSEHPQALQPVPLVYWTPTSP